MWSKGICDSDRRKCDFVVDYVFNESEFVSKNLSVDVQTGDSDNAVRKRW